jgi:thiopurine S-methyltransferase
MLHKYTSRRKASKAELTTVTPLNNSLSGARTFRGVIMKAEFWLQKWQVRDIGFHQAEVNPLLVEFFKDLSLDQGSRVLVPLCGKSLDIAWLLANGYRVAGAELSEMAIEELFTELGIDPEISEVGELRRFSAESIDIFVGDIFALSPIILGKIDAVYDRAALVALPEDTRHLYTEHLIQITHKAPQFLICFEYDQDSMQGPPFSIDTDEVDKHYRDAYHLKRVASVDVAGGLKGVCAAKENVWLLLKDS